MYSVYQMSFSFFRQVMLDREASKENAGVGAIQEKRNARD